MSKSCAACKKNITAVRNPGISCVSCGFYFHAICVNINKESLEDIRQNNLSWSCASCLKKNKRRSIIFPEPQNSSPAASVSVSSSTSVNSKLLALEEAFNNYKLSNDRRIEELEAKVTAKQEEIRILKLKLIETQTNLCNIEDKLLSTNLEIQGLPKELSADPVAASSYVGESIGCNIDHFEVDSYISNEASKSTLIISFKSKVKRQRFLEAGKKFNRERRKLSYNNNQCKIFVNEQLSQQKKKLLYETKLFARSNHFKFSWICNNLVHLKKNQDSHPIIIKSFQQLEELKNGISEHILPERARSSFESTRDSQNIQHQQL